MLYFGFSQAQYVLEENDGHVNSTVYIIKENYAEVQTTDDITVSFVITGGSATAGTV